jgi:hypothetical protein
LYEHLRDRLAKYGPLAENEPNRPVLATFFVTDRHGTIIAIAYAETPDMESNSLGRNFFYRSYFHGGREDLDPQAPREKVQPLRSTHLSAPFPSTATSYWKIAVSTPIFVPGNTTGKPDGVFVGTINLGDFRLLNAGAEANMTQLAALVDSRPGARLGTILQHPLMDQRALGDGVKANETFPPVTPDQLDSLLEQGMVDYADPLATVEGGEPFRGGWIATAQHVRLPLSTNKGNGGALENSDLTVLVQYKLEQVLAPVGKLVEHLMFEGAVTVISILAVMMVLWYFVNRINDSGTTVKPHPSDSEEPAVTEVVRM